MATEPVKAASPFEGDPTIGRLVTDASRDISSLISKEIQLAKSELKVSVQAGGIGIGLFAAAAFVAMLAIIMLSVAFAYLINWNGEGLDLHWAFLIVFACLPPHRGAAGLRGLSEGQAGPAARQGDPPGQGDPPRPQGSVLTGSSSSRRLRTETDPAERHTNAASPASTDH